MSRARDLADSADLNFDDGTLVIDSGNNRVGIGTNSPASTLDVNGEVTANDDVTFTSGARHKFIGGGSGNNLELGTYSSFNTARNIGLVIDSAGNVGIGTSSPKSFSGQTHVTVNHPTGGTNVSGYSLRVADTEYSSLITYPSNSEGLRIATVTALPMTFQTNNTEAMRIDSSGNLLVGSTSDAGTDYHLLANDGFARHVRDSATVMILDRTTSDGSIALFRKDGSTVGSIGTAGGDLIVGTGVTGLRFRDVSDAIIPINTTGAIRDNAIDIGESSYRWKDLYLSGGVYLGGTGSANYLEDYEEGTFTPYLSNDSGTDLIGTYGEQYGTYAKIGERVYFTIRCTSGSGLSGTAGELRVQGLPYVQSSSGFEAYVSMYLWFYSGLGGLSSGDVLISRGQINGTHLVIQKQNGGVSNSVTNTDFGNSLNMSICGHYKTPS